MSEYLLFGVDFAKEGSSDMSAVVSVCSSCHTAIEKKVADPQELGISLQLYKECPHCNVKFESFIGKTEWERRDAKILLDSSNGR